jgi:hypothetical protein
MLAVHAGRVVGLDQRGPRSTVACSPTGVARDPGQRRRRGAGPAAAARYATCAVLVTSRYQLSGLVGLAALDLGVVSTANAVALLGKAAGAAKVRAERDAAEELSRLCGGLPLALRVVGVKVANSPYRTVPSFVGRFAEERHRLDQLARVGRPLQFGLQLPADRPG